MTGSPSFTLAASVDVLHRTPAVLGALLEGLAEPWIRATEGDETFSPFDVVGHLVDSEETNWMPRAAIILAQDQEPCLGSYDRFRHRARNADCALSSLLEELRRLRAANLDRLSSWRLTDRHLELAAVHPTLGRVTLRQLLASWVVHDLGHIAQVARVLAKRYRNEVGPWVACLPVLTDRPAPRS